MQTLLKIKFQDILIQNKNGVGGSLPNSIYTLELTKEQLKRKIKTNSDGKKVQQQHNLLFRLIKIATKKEILSTDEIKEFILIDCSCGKTKDKELSKLIKEGFIFQGKKFLCHGKSASQGKDGIICFMSEDIYDEVTKATMMDIEFEDNMCAISKFEAYRHLLMSSSDFLDFIPNVVIVDDFEKTIHNQKIKRVKEDEQVSRGGTKYKKRIIVEDVADVGIVPFDGMGIHSPDISAKFEKCLNLDYSPVSYQIRGAYLKGLSTEFDFKRWCKKEGVGGIADKFGKFHDVKDIDCIWTSSMWKGDSHFKSWDDYIKKMEKYNHCFGISKYNKTTKQETKYTRLNFQYLQTLDLSTDDIIELAQYSKDWAEDIIKGSPVHTMKFLGLMGDEDVDLTGSNVFVEAIKINKKMLKDEAVQRNIHKALKGIIEQMKIGKIYARGKYSFAIGDLKGFMEYITGQDIIGCLQEQEFYEKYQRGKYASFRSPLVHSSEINPVTFVENDFTKEWCNHLDNVVMLGLNDISAPRQGGIALSVLLIGNYRGN